MNDPFNASTEPDGGATIASSLSTIIDRFGPAIFFRPEEVRLQLRQDCPDANREIDLVLATLAHGVPQRLLAAHGDAAVVRMSSESVDRLTADPAFDRATATWSVRTWAIALALPVADLERPLPAASAVTARSSFASVVTPLAGPRRDERAAPVAPPRAASVAAPVPPPIVPAPSPSTPVPIVVQPAPPVPPPIVSTPTPAIPVPIVVQPAPPVPPPIVSTPTPAIPVPIVVQPAPPVPPVAPIIVHATEPAPSHEARRPDAARVEPAAPAPMPQPVVVDAAAAARPVTRSSFPLKSTIAVVALLGVALAAWFLSRQAPVGPTTSPPVVASVPAPNAALAARPEPPAIVPPSKVASQTAPAAVAVEPPRRVAADPAPQPLIAAPPVVTRSEPPKPAQTRAPERPTIARTDVTRAPAIKPSPTTVTPAVTAAPTKVAATPPAGAACTRATCGSVVSVRPLDATGPSVELIVRMDDRGIHTVRQSGQWRVGSRVQRIDDRYVAIRASAPR